MNWTWSYRADTGGHRLTVDFATEEVLLSKLDIREPLFRPDALRREEDAPRMLRALADKLDAELARR